MSGDNLKTKSDMFKKLTFISCLIILPILFSSCDSFIGKVCTAEFRILGVAVYTTEEKPVILDELTITATPSRNGKEGDGGGNGYDGENDGQAGWPEEGIYTIFHDGMKGAIRRGAIEIKVTGKNERVQFEEEFIISSNGCHVTKEAGPDTVYLEVE
jgi:hypothetical protein